MYLHIGNGESIKTKDIIGIFDLDTSTISKKTKNYINKKEKEGKVEYTDFDLPRAFIICYENKEEKVKLSRISSQGLVQRIKSEIKGYQDQKGY